MASVDNISLIDNKPPDDQRWNNIKLRDAGLQYISKSGRIVPAKKQPGEICNCPQRCTDKVPHEIREKLFIEFYKMADQVHQNRFLQKYIEMRSVQKRLWSEEHRVDGRLQRRVSCKYHIPIDANFDTCRSRESDKGQSAHIVKKYKKRANNNTVEVCQKAFMNMYTITEKRVRFLREKLIMKSRQNVKNDTTPATAPHIDEIETAYSLAKYMLSTFASPLSHNNSANISQQTILSSIDRDITLVNNFFFDQLWKLEEIGETKGQKPNSTPIEISVDDENNNNTD
ncbi:uncharacterized protein LOC111050355 [Nilaparvata lugens]|uniref:uncharacterized protein LOC111050355 n=1 Tax=Nilaparvata lugens TaxID=108931 RepID=UPI00193D7B98|nr:uncharacterized protein LOC111050355 [Nilaparvata lugens]